MEGFLNFLRVLDSFGLVYNFRYRDKKKFQTAIGGFFFILFLIVVFVLGILSFIPFVLRKNYTIVYYTMNLAQTEEVNIFESDSNFAVGLSCEVEKNEKNNIFDLLDLKSNYVSYHKFSDGSYKKFPKEYLGRLHHQLVLFGRYYCKAQNPICNTCSLSNMCRYYKKIKKGD